MFFKANNHDQDRSFCALFPDCDFDNKSQQTPNKCKAISIASFIYFNTLVKLRVLKMPKTDILTNKNGKYNFSK